MDARRFLIATRLAVGLLMAVALSAASAPVSAVASPGHATGKANHRPGTLISALPLDVASIDGAVYRVEYWSESVPSNKPVKVTGLVVVPGGVPPSGGWPVVSWGHPTDGLTANCAPSLDPTTAVPFLNDLLAQGWVVTSSDYLNENALAPGSKKVLPYLVGEEAARNVIDIVRAARQIPAADAGSQYQVWGWSEGGQTALWAAHIAASYAPELTLQGAVATAPGSDLTSLYTSLASNPGYWPLLLMVAEGLSSAYGKAAPLNQLLTKTGIKVVDSDVAKEPQCLLGVLGIASHYSFNQLFLSDAVPASWQKLLDENDPAQFTSSTSTPVLIVHGSADTTAPTATSAVLADQLCSLSPPQPLERWVYDGLDHISIMGQPVGPSAPSGNADTNYQNSPSEGDIIQWMSDRFAGGTWPDPYVPTGGGITSVTVTNSC